jgi:hypothetical protein
MEDLPGDGSGGLGASGISTPTTGGVGTGESLRGPGVGNGDDGTEVVQDTSDNTITKMIGHLNEFKQ